MSSSGHSAGDGPSGPQPNAEPGKTERRSRTNWIRDWRREVTAIGAFLVGVAAVAGILLTYLSSNQSVRATDSQLKLAQEQQVTDEYTTAITDLGSSSIDVRLGGVYLLQQLMNASPSEQSTVVNVLCAFVRDQSTSPVAVVQKQDLVNYLLPTDIQAALP
jgi:hypothetical protein